MNNSSCFIIYFKPTLFHCLFIIAYTWIKVYKIINIIYNLLQFLFTCNVFKFKSGHLAINLSTSIYSKA